MRQTFLKNIKSKIPVLKTTEDSKQIYDEYDDREQKTWESKSGRCLYNNRIIRLSFKQMRKYYLKYLYEQIDILMGEGKTTPIKILEVGCGNCINMVNLKTKYGDNVILHGIDISEKRITVAKSYFGDNRSGVTLQSKSITDNTGWDNNHFDLVFSMHCLEQIPYKTEDAVLEMYRLTNNKLVLIEPVFELGNTTQRLYLYVQDHNRILLRTIKKLGYNIQKIKILNIQSNPLNQSSIIVIDKNTEDVNL